MSEEKKNIREHIVNNVKDLVSNLMYYDRKECEDLPVGEIENAVNDGLISYAEIVDVFKSELEALYAGEINVIDLESIKRDCRIVEEDNRLYGNKTHAECVNALVDYLNDKGYLGVRKK